MEGFWAIVAILFIFSSLATILSEALDGNIAVLFALGGLIIFFYGGINRKEELLIAGGLLMLGTLVDWREWSRRIRGKE